MATAGDAVAEQEEAVSEVEAGIGRLWLRGVEARRRAEVARRLAAPARCVSWRAAARAAPEWIARGRQRLMRTFRGLMVVPSSRRGGPSRTGLASDRAEPSTNATEFVKRRTRGAVSL